MVAEPVLLRKMTAHLNEFSCIVSLVSLLLTDNSLDPRVLFINFSFPFKAKRHRFKPMQHMDIARAEEHELLTID